MRSIPYTEDDLFVYENEIRPWLPEKLFDAHVHCIDNANHPRIEEEMPMAARDPLLGNVDLAYIRQWWQALFPDAVVRGLLLGFPSRSANWRAENDFVAGCAQGTDCLFSLLVHPTMSPEELESGVRKYRPAGLKPYLVFVDLDDPNEARITDMLPEPLLNVANRHGLAVTLHVAKPRGMADAENLSDIARLVKDYPRVQFILAHCGRCFIAPNMEAALEKLPVAENLWLDTSAVCDTGVFLHLFRDYDKTRLLFGTDLVTATGFRGTYTRLGMSWHPCTADTVWGLPPRATFAAYENLAALCRALRFCGWKEEDRCGLFFRNAETLFGAWS